MDLSGFSTSAAKWVNLNSDGTPGALTQVPGGSWYYLLWVLLYEPWKLWVWLMASTTTLGIH